ncbi:lysylphosphatidylglycerol synthase transmembrane domain-containing protein [Saccharopolyspora sp. WRP15-2]|uniref:Lysylphosphatidylglycerol synthase transmembrane domain-containing protein n=1 Tax=Saccharopolyspora oryzae TaxID=2997343 RepID=A0ABT4UTV6_9PSEU|nr:lysylphosphatidylglycerol synthase transmembrane domain-containing protein [Saccharopolyspora oryzae]MDA3625146.1 lysylphosphatidylglycerol synthase transmembrane domain-containing protein [Saccharopolyspora oryzae]
MRNRIRTIAQWTVVLCGLGVLGWQFPALAAEAGRLGGELAHLSWIWFGVAIALSVASLVAYGELHRRLLLAGGVVLPVRTVQAINFAENALSTTLPAVGNAAGFAYAAVQLRKRGVDLALGTWSVVLCGVVATAVLALLGLAGAGGTGVMSPLLAGLLAAGLLITSCACWVVLVRSSALHRCLRGCARLVRAMPGRTTSWAKDPDAVARRLSDRIAMLRPSGRQWAAIVSFAALSWIVDYLSLCASVAALGHPVPWSTLVAGYLAVQGAIALQVFPGGAGLAEAGLLGVLLASGTPIAPALATVLVYRSINWLLLAALGWGVYGVQIHLAPDSGARHRVDDPVPHRIGG